MVWGLGFAGFGSGVIGFSGRLGFRVAHEKLA